MGGASCKVDIAQVKRRIGRIAGRLEDPRPALKNIGEYMLRVTDERFREEKDPDGKPWAPLAAATKAKKKNTKILTESSHLRGRVVYRALKNILRFGTNVIYAAIHQFGGKIKRQVAVPAHSRTITQAFGKSIPARKILVKAHSRNVNIRIKKRRFLGVNARDRREMDDIVTDYVTS